MLIDDTDNWAEPLDTMFARILAADLQQRLPSSTILTEDNSTSPDLRFTIDANIERFNLVDNDAVLLKGDFIIKDKTTYTKPQATPFQWTLDADPTPQSVAKSLSRLIGKLADDVAQNIDALSLISPIHQK